MRPFAQKHKDNSRIHGWFFWLLAVVLVFLSLAIVNWGLQYKMSLYRNINAPHPAAKLWTGARDTTLTGQPAVELRLVSTVSLEAIFLCLFIALFLERRSYRALITFLQRQRTDNSRKMQVAAFCNSLLFRPPPAFA